MAMQNRVETMFRNGLEGWEILLKIREEFPEIPFYSTLEMVEELQSASADNLIWWGNTRQEKWEKTLAWAKATMEPMRQVWNKEMVEKAWLAGETPDATWNII